MDIEYRLLDGAVDLSNVIELEIAIWNLDPIDAVPANILYTTTHNGGVLIVAYAHEQPVGMCLGFPGKRGREWFLWSHMAGVHPHFQGRGIGTQLKLMQRDWARQQGYSTIRWTFDPLQRGNANFNIHRLGATADAYHVNYYGEMTDEINSGLPSDRLEVVWKTKGPLPRRTNPPAPQSFLLVSDSDGAPETREFHANQQVACVEIPRDLTTLKTTNYELALRWRFAVRDALQAALERHYTISDFAESDNRFLYLLSPPQPWFMYVVECNDQTFYTGITNNLDRRVDQHNRGKGAAYTASRRPVRLLAAWQFSDRSQALKAEFAFKKKTRHAKIAQIESQTVYRDGVFVESS